MNFWEEAKFLWNVIWTEFREFLYRLPIFIDKFVGGAQGILSEVSGFIGTIKKEMEDLFRQLRW